VFVCRVRNRSAFPITDTLLKLMAAAASGGDGDAEGVVDEGEEQVLTNVAHRVATKLICFDDAAEVAFDQGHSC